MSTDRLGLARAGLARSAGSHADRPDYKALPRRVARLSSARSRSRLAFVARSAMLFKLQDLPARTSGRSSSVAWDYADTGGVDAQLSILVDPLSVYMCLVVSGVSALIHLYSVAYMGSRPRLHALLRLPELLRLLDAAAGPRRQLPGADHRLGVRRRGVVPADLVLVPARHRDEGRHQGVRHQRRRRRRARARHVLHLPRTSARSTSSAAFAQVDDAFGRNDGDLVAGCLLLLVGAFAKSAQVPLHTWLPDAMEGPTPVSALIHAATMVTAGVYLIARMHPLFEQAPAAADVGAIIGCVDAADRRHDRAWS